MTAAAFLSAASRVRCRPFMAGRELAPGAVVARQGEACLHRQVGAIHLLLALLCRVNIHRAAGAYGTEFIDPDELQHRLMGLFGRGNALFEAFDIPDEDAKPSANSAIADILGADHAGYRI